METYYDVLQCKDTATFEEIKKSYQQLAKEYHPDKLSNESHDKFLKIDEAWRTLRDNELRKKYDAKILQGNFSQKSLVYEEINLGELEFDENCMATYPCRCGGTYLIDNKLIDCKCEIECDECSYVLVINKNDKT